MVLGLASGLGQVTRIDQIDVGLSLRTLNTLVALVKTLVLHSTFV